MGMFFNVFCMCFGLGRLFCVELIKIFIAYESLGFVKGGGGGLIGCLDV